MLFIIKRIRFFFFAHSGTSTAVTSITSGYRVQTVYTRPRPKTITITIIHRVHCPLNALTCARYSVCETSNARVDLRTTIQTLSLSFCLRRNGFHCWDAYTTIPRNRAHCLVTVETNRIWPSAREPVPRGNYYFASLFVRAASAI